MDAYVIASAPSSLLARLLLLNLLSCLILLRCPYCVCTVHLTLSSLSTHMHCRVSSSLVSLYSFCDTPYSCFGHRACILVTIISAYPHHKYVYSILHQHIPSRKDSLFSSSYHLRRPHARPVVHDVRNMFTRLINPPHVLIIFFRTLVLA